MRFVKLICILLLSQSLLAQEFEQIAFIEGDVHLFVTNELEQLIIAQRDVIELYDADGKFLFRNSGKRFGQISSIDATYSLKPIVFFKEQMEMMLLDNTLSRQGDVIPLDLRGFPQASLLCSSVQNHYWIYDQLNLELVRINDQFSKVNSTGRLDQLLNISPNPNFIIEYNNWLYVNDPVHGVLVFDIYGTYYKTIPLLGLERLQVRGEHIYFFTEGQFQSYNMKSFEQNVLAVPVDNPLGVRKEKQRLYIRTIEGLHIYRIKP